METAISSTESASIGATLADLRKIVHTLPHLDNGDTTFETDVIATANSQPSMPEERMI